mgnify:CR=1 FL=1
MIRIETVALVVNCITSISLTVCAIIALNQIKIGKEQIAEQKKASTINSKRESLKTTSEQIRYYSDILIPLISYLDDIIKREKNMLFEKSSINITGDRISVDAKFGNGDLEKIKEFAVEFTNVNNGLCTLATYFISGVADEEFAFPIIGNTYCNTIKKYLPVMYRRENDKISESYPLKLFMIWNNRIEYNKKSEEIADLENKLNNIPKGRIKPIG